MMPPQYKPKFSGLRFWFAQSSVISCTPFRMRPEVWFFSQPSTTVTEHQHKQVYWGKVCWVLRAVKSQHRLPRNSLSHRDCREAAWPYSGCGVCPKTQVQVLLKTCFRGLSILQIARYRYFQQTSAFYKPETQKRMHILSCEQPMSETDEHICLSTISKFIE